MDVIELIEQDHREVESVFQLLRAGSGNRVELVQQLATLLQTHTDGEERIVYPVIRDANPDGDSQVREGIEEHDEADSLLQRLLAADPSSFEFSTLVLDLQRAVEHHVREEENEILPDFREHTDSSTRSRLAEEFRSFKAGAMPDHAASTPMPSAAPAVSGVATSDLSAMKKDELYELAKEADIPGRSNMKKDELVEALRSSS